MPRVKVLIKDAGKVSEGYIDIDQETTDKFADEERKVHAIIGIVEYKRQLVLTRKDVWENMDKREDELLDTILDPSLSEEEETNKFIEIVTRSGNQGGSENKVSRLTPLERSKR